MTKTRCLKCISMSLLVVMISGGLISCSNTETNISKIDISGSTSVGPIMEELCEQYENKNSAISVEINQVGSSAGIKDVISGVSQIAMASRELKDSEKLETSEYIIAYDGIAVIVNKSNNIKGLTLQQVKDIYTGKIKNWNVIDNGKDQPIVVVSREDGSGTRSAFQDIVGYNSEELVENATISDGNGNIKSIVEGNENAIGFISFEYLNDAISNVEIDGVKLTVDSVKSASYKLARPFILATKKNSGIKKEKNLIDYILSDEGQNIIKENKLIPVK